MQLETLMSQRHSCRAFRPDPVDPETLTRMFAMAQNAPSDCNSQPWAVSVLSGDSLDALRADMMAAARAGRAPLSDIPPIKAYEGIYQDRRRACGWALYEAVGVTKGDRVGSGQQALENFRFFGAPHLAVISSPLHLGPRALVDCGIYMGHLLLAAQSLGIASLAQGALALYTDILRAHAGISEDRQIICGMALGYSDRDHPANAFHIARAPLSETVAFLG